MSKHKNEKFATKCVHSGTEIDPTTGAVITPIYQTSTFAQVSPGVNYPPGCMYTRLKNPTRMALETCMTELEGGAFSMVTASGMGAINLVYFSLLKAGDHVVSIDDVYGGTRELNTEIIERMGVEFTYTDMNRDDLDTVFKKNTKLVVVESPTNPTLKVTDIKKVCEVAHKKGVPVMIDSTFMSPYLQKPFEWGCDFVVHSMTKYLNGHSDVVMGVVVVKDQSLYKRFFTVYKSLGANPSPSDVFLCQRGVKTLPIRMDITCKNAQAVAEFLETHKNVEKVLYPGLKSHPQYELAKKQTPKGHGGVVTFYMKGGKEECDVFLKALKVFTLAVSLGGVESLAECPVLMTHAGVPKEDRLKVGITDNLIRLAVGIEDIDDLVGDLKQSLDKVGEMKK